MKHGANIKELAGLNAKMCLLLVDKNFDHDKVKCMNKNVVIKIIHGNTKMFCWLINVSDIRWI